VIISVQILQKDEASSENPFGTWKQIRVFDGQWMGGQRALASAITLADNFGSVPAVVETFAAGGTTSLGIQHQNTAAKALDAAAMASLIRPADPVEEAESPVGSTEPAGMNNDLASVSVKMSGMDDPITWDFDLIGQLAKAMHYLASCKGVESFTVSYSSKATFQDEICDADELLNWLSGENESPDKARLKAMSDAV